MYKRLIAFVDEIKNVSQISLILDSDKKSHNYIYFENGIMYHYNVNQIFQVYEDCTQDKKGADYFNDKKFKFDLDEFIYFTKNYKKNISKFEIENNNFLLEVNSVNKIECKWNKKDDMILKNIKNHFNINSPYFTKELNKEEIELLNNNEFEKIELIDNLKMHMLKKYISKINKTTNSIIIKLYNTNNDFIKIIEIEINNKNLISHNYGKIVI